MDQDISQRLVADHRILDQATQELERSPFWAMKERRRLQDKRSAAMGRIAQAAPKVADMVLQQAFAGIRVEESHRNPYHREVLSQLDDLSRRTATAALQSKAPTISSAAAFGQQWLAYSHVAQLLTAERTESLIVRIVNVLREIANDPVFLYRPYITADGTSGYRVQHKASGLRGDFTLSETGRPHIGTVFSKPYNLRSIDPDNHPGEILNDWERYVGLGIGKKLYQAAAQLMPETRWQSSVASTYAAGARTRLHLADPWRWQGSGCTWCHDHDTLWAEASPEFFADHPRAELPGDVELVDVTPAV